MIEEGLFDQFPVDSVYGMHNWPGLDVGQFALRTGPMEASADTFNIYIRGVGAHAAMPHLGIDPMVIAAQLITAFQTIVSRNANPIDAAVVSVTQINAGTAYNVIPAQVDLRGCLRALNPETQTLIKTRMKTIVKDLCHAFSATGEISFTTICPVLINAENETNIAAAVARSVVGDVNVDSHYPPTMGSEDFAFMLQASPGSYIFIGNGKGESSDEGGCMLHNAGYDFNDKAIVPGVTYWCRLAETILSRTVQPDATQSGICEGSAES